MKINRGGSSNFFNYGIRSLKLKYIFIVDCGKKILAAPDITYICNTMYSRTMVIIILCLDHNNIQ